MVCSLTDAMHRIFISYRRSDSQDVTGRIYDRLLTQFGPDTIFKDVDAIPLGGDFKQHLTDAVTKCQVLLAIVGAHWLDPNDEAGTRRLDSADDFVRIELEAALARGIPVIPVLLGHAAMPTAGQLPPSLAAFASRQATAVRPDPDFHRDMNRLVASLQAMLAPPKVADRTLADRLLKGPLALEEALRLAIAIAGALESLHRQGRIDGTLSPDHILLTKTGVKLSTGEAALSDDVKAVAYRSPEQLEGQDADARTDIFAFGAVLYEMLTGKKAFAGDDVSDTRAAVRRGQPDWMVLPQEVPSPVRLLLQRCLERDRGRRIGDVAVVVFVLNEATNLAPALHLASARPAAQARMRRRTALALVGLLVVGAFVTTAWWVSRPSALSRATIRFQIPSPGVTAAEMPTLSADGRSLAFVATTG